MPGSPVGLVCLRDVMRAAKREIGRAAWGERVEFRRVLFRSAFFIFSLMGTRAEILRKRNARQSGRTGVPARCHARRETRDRKSGVGGESGVQTCALPICIFHFFADGNTGRNFTQKKCPAVRSDWCACAMSCAPRNARSEERRGGREWSSDVCSSDLHFSFFR